MTYAQLIAFINQWIYTNGNNEITAATLNPVLQAIADRSQDVTGNLEDLATVDNTTLVAAINEVLSIAQGNNGGIRLHTGVDNPNVTPPASFGYADFYMQVDGSNNPLQLFQYDGFQWVVPGGGAINITSATATAGTEQDFTLPTSKVAFQVFVSRTKLFDSEFSQSGTTLTISFECFGGETVEIYHQ